MYVPYITNCLRWEGFAIFMDWLVTAKLFHCNHGMAMWHYYTPMELWIFSSELWLSSITMKFLYLEQFAIIQYVNLLCKGGGTSPAGSVLAGSLFQEGQVYQYCIEY